MEGAGTCGELCEHCLLTPGPSLAAASAVSGHLSTSHQWPPAPSMAPACVGCAWDVPCPSLQPGWFAVCGQWLRAELPDSHPLPNPLPSSCGFSRVKVLQVVQSQRGCGEWSRQGMELAGSGVAAPGRSVPAVPVPVCHPQCPSSCSKGLDQSQGGGWVIALSLDFWRGRQMPSTCQSPPGERCHITNSPVGLCHDALWKLRPRMRLWAGTGFRALLPSFPLEFGTNMPLRSRALVTFLPPCLVWGQHPRRQEQPCPCRGAGLALRRTWASWSTSCKMDSRSLANPPPTASPPRKQSTEPAQGFSQEAVAC